MGITGLLPFIKNSYRSANLKDFSGATVAIDAYSWLHKGAFSCAEKLVKGEKTDGYVYYCAKLLNMLLESGVKPIMVFDGCNLHSKAVTEKKRRENREKTRQRGKELLCEGKLKEARECFQRCVDVTPEMAREVIEMCRKKSVDCIVAPYEADAQLAYLNKSGMAQIVITEDSDLVLFGCDKIFFKMDSFGGGLLYEKENLPKTFGNNASKFSFEKFRYTCILSGCDYLPSLPGIGLAKASKFFMLTCNLDLNSVLKKIPSYLKMPNLEVTDEYIDSFIKANNTFLYQLVFCPQKKCLVPLNPYPEGINASDMEYAGKYLPDDLASELAAGNINVKTLKRFKVSDDVDSLSGDTKNAVWKSIAEGPKRMEPPKAEVTAFQFNSKKVKGIKRKLESDRDIKPSACQDDDEDLFSMYRNLNSSVKDEEELEEDPLVDIYEEKSKLSSCFSPVKLESDFVKSSDKSARLSMKRIVRSRFFASKSESEEASIVLRENSPGKKISQQETTVEIMDISQEEEPLKVETEIKLETPTVKSNKENIAHRFAKKMGPKPSIGVSSADITSSLATTERSWLDIMDDECSSITVSSSSLPTKILDTLDSKESVAKKDKSESNGVRIKKKKLITTKLLDFKWSKESTSKRKSEPLETESDIELDVSEPTNNKSVVSSFFNNCTVDDVDFNSSKSELNDEDIDDPPSSATSCKSSSDACCSQESSKSKIVISLAAKQFNAKSSYKPGKCHPLGLSKNRRSFNKRASIQDTLMSFNFVKKPKNEVIALT